MTETKKSRAIIDARLACKDKWTDIRLGEQVEVAENLANEHGLIVDNVITEVGSGSSLKQRPGFRTVLDQARSGQVTHVIVADMTQFLRDGKATDWRHIAKAFAAGVVTVVTSDGAFGFSVPKDRDLFLAFGLALGSQIASTHDRKSRILV